jgi:hypothetical protein
MNARDRAGIYFGLNLTPLRRASWPFKRRRANL